MPILVACSCGTPISVDAAFAGKTITCPACKRVLPVPAAEYELNEPDLSKVKNFTRKLGSTPESNAPPPRPTPPPRKPAPPRRPVMEVLLDPRSIQWMLTLGGALMMLGLIIWLANFPFFRRPEILAIAIGVGTFAVLAGGCALVLKTRYRVAGQALAFLACAAAPLNLWFYHAQNLITLEGHLWVAGVVVCLLYAGTAYALRDPLFIYAVEGGLTLTMLLFLAELGDVGHMTTLSMCLVVLGVLSVHAERAFAPEEGDFSRRRFGLPLFWSGQAQVGAGLLVMLAAQVMGWLHAPVKSVLGYEWGGVNAEGFPIWPVIAWVVGTYVYIYSDVIVRRIGVYLFLAAICLLMAEVTAVGWLQPDGPVLIAILSLTAMAANLLRFVLKTGHEKLIRALAPLGVALSVLPLLLGVVLHIRATSVIFRNTWHYETTWWFVAAMVLVMATSRVSAFLYRKEKTGWSVAYFAFAAVALMIAAAGLMTMIGITIWTQQAPFLMLIPIAYMLASRAWRGHTPEEPLAWVAQAATLVLLVPVVIDGLERFDTFTAGSTSNLWRGMFFAEAAVFYGLTAAIRRRGANIYLAAAMAAGAIWQLLAYANTPEPYYAVVFATLGLALLIFYRLAGRLGAKFFGVVMPAFQCANGALTAAFVAALLQGLARLAVGHVQERDLVAEIITAVVSLLASWLVLVRAWKRWYVVTTIGLFALSFVMINVLSNLSGWQKLEIFCTAAGMAMLVVGYLGRLRETPDHPNDLISLSLWFGSLLATVPVLVAVCWYRFGYREVSMVNELSLLTITVAMAFTGFIFQFKSTTLIGGAALVAHLAILLIAIGMRAQVAIGVYLAIGGATVFGIGVALAIYRERLLALPGRIANHEGVFRVFGWR